MLMLDLIINNLDGSREILVLLSFSVTSSFLLGKTLCSLYNEIMAGKDAEDLKRMHFKP